MQEYSTREIADAIAGSLDIEPAEAEAQLARALAPYND